jgi:hypothetical protein
MPLHTKPSPFSHTPAAIPVLRWVFERHGIAITCGVDMNEANRCDVSVIPHWDLASCAVEHFDSPMAAIARHAELSLALREEGWVVTDRVS